MYYTPPVLVSVTLSHLPGPEPFQNRFRTVAANLYNSFTTPSQLQTRITYDLYVNET